MNSAYLRICVVSRNVMPICLGLKPQFNKALWWRKVITGKGISVYGNERVD